jgi:DNA-binding response OmpR family regulator
MSDAPPAAARLLIVEDEPAIALAMSEYLEACGHAVETVHDRAAAEALLSPGRHDLVIADLRLRAEEPRDGLRVVQRAAALHPRPRILVLTAYGSPALEAKLAAAGVDLVLGKPQPLAGVAAAISGLLAGAGASSFGTGGVRKLEAPGG